MRVFSIAFLISLVCVSGTVFAAPDEKPAAAKAVARNVSVQLMDYGEGADRKIKLTLSDKWSNLPDSTKKHVLAKLKAALPEASLKQALLALAKGETEIEVSAAPGKIRVAPTAMVKVVPATPLVPARAVVVKRIEMKPSRLVRLGNPAQKVIVLGGAGGMKGDNVEIEVEIIKADGTDEITEEARKQILEALKKQGAVRMRLGQPGGAVKLLEVRSGHSDGCRTFAKDVKTELKVMVTGDGNWQQLPPEKRRQVLQSLRQTVPPEQMAEVLKALMHGGSPRAGSFYVQPMAGRPGCRCGGPGPNFSGRRGHGMRGMRGGRGHGGGGGYGLAQGGGYGFALGGDHQGALVRALVALTNEVRALRGEVAAMRATHHGRPPVIRPHAQTRPPRRMMMGGAVGTAPKPPSPPSHPKRVVLSKDARITVGGVAVPSTGVRVMTRPSHKNTKVEQDMAKIRAEMAEIRAALHRLVKDLKKLQTEK